MAASRIPMSDSIKAELAIGRIAAKHTASAYDRVRVLRRCLERAEEEQRLEMANGPKKPSDLASPATGLVPPSAP